MIISFENKKKEYEYTERRFMDLINSKEDYDLNFDETDGSAVLKITDDLMERGITLTDEEINEIFN